MHYIQGKGWFEASGKPVGSMRKVHLALARIYGQQNDITAFTRLIIESRCSRASLNEAWRTGAALRTSNG